MRLSPRFKRSRDAKLKELLPVKISSNHSSFKIFTQLLNWGGGGGGRIGVNRDALICRGKFGEMASL